MAEKPIPIQTALMPAYYKDFHCIMGACQDNCCDDGWRIEFNKKDYLTIKRTPKSGEMEELMRQGMRRLREREHDGMYAEFFLTEAGRCAFHTPEGLCRLQLECGEECLPLVCRVYPRREAYTPAALEYSVSPSCEGVLSLLWGLEEGVDFIEEPLPPAKHRVAHPQNPVDARFAAVRSLWIDALQARSLPLARRLTLLGLLAQQLQGLDWSDEAAVDRWLASSEGVVQDPGALSEQLGRTQRNRQMFLSNNLQLLIKQFNTLGPDLPGELLSAVTGKASLSEVDTQRVTIAAGHYQELEDKLEELMGHSEHFFENILVAISFFLAFPALSSPEELWKSYVNLCNLYGFYRFAAVCAMDREPSRERLFHVLVHVSRSLIHNPTQRARLRDEMFQNDSATLAHMAILAGG